MIDKILIPLNMFNYTSLPLYSAQSFVEFFVIEKHKRNFTKNLFINDLCLILLSNFSFNDIFVACKVRLLISLFYECIYIFNDVPIKESNNKIPITIIERYPHQSGYNEEL